MKAEELRAEYLRGWTDGATASAPDLRASLSYQVGYADGRAAWWDAVAKAEALISDDVVEYGA